MRSLPVLSIVLTTTFLERCSSFSTRCALVGRSPCVGSVGRTPRLRQLRPGILEEVEAPVQLDKGSAEVAVREQAQSQQQLDESNEDEATAERGLGILVLLTVPLAWGTCEFSKVLRHLLFPSFGPLPLSICRHPGSQIYV